MPKNPAAETAELDIPPAETVTPTLSQRALGLFETVRGHPRTAIAAGAAIAAGVTAAAAIPLARARGRNKANGKGEGGSGTTAATRTPARRRAAPKKKG